MQLHNPLGWIALGLALLSGAGMWIVRRLTRRGLH